MAKISEETRRKLDRILLVQRLKWVAAACVAAAAVIGFFILIGLDAEVEDYQVAGRVEHIGIASLKTAMQAVTVDVALEDGRHARVIAAKEHEPHVGDRVRIVEHRHATGRVTFTWR
jgi:hypothetical protein